MNSPFDRTDIPGGSGLPGRDSAYTPAMAKRRGPVLLELIGETKSPPMRPIPRPGQTPSAPSEPTPSTRIDAPPIARIDPRQMRAPAQGPSAPAPSHAAPEPQPDASPRSRFSPGRTLRVPFGYVFFVAAAVLILFAIAWALGHRSGVKDVRAEQAAKVAPDFEGPGPSRDPYTAVVPSPTQQPITQGPGRAATPPQIPQRPIVPAADPRQAGLNYYIIDRYDPATAARAVEFLRSSGLDVFAWPDENPTFHLIVTVQGFPRGSLSSPEARALGDQIKRLGRVWKQQNRGPSDFSSAYLKKHDSGR